MYVEKITGSVSPIEQFKPKKDVKSVKKNDETKKKTKGFADSLDISQKITDVEEIENRDDRVRLEREERAENRNKVEESGINVLPNTRLKYGIHEKTDRVIVKLVDEKTDEIVKEYPQEKTLDQIAKCLEVAGVLVDEKL